MYEATFRLGTDGGYAGVTADLDARLALWCNDHCDLIRIAAAPADVDAVVDTVESIAGVDDAVVEDDRAVCITDRCVKEVDDRTVDDHLDENGCLLLPPIRYEDGARLCRVLALEPDRLSALYRSLTEAFAVSVDAKRELDTVPSGDRPVSLEAAVPSLSRRQRQVFTAAYDRGYYELPRETTMEAVADSIGIDRRTAEEHRRRAERKLLAALVEHAIV